MDGVTVISGRGRSMVADVHRRRRLRAETCWTPLAASSRTAVSS